MGTKRSASVVQRTDSATAKLEGGKTQASLAKVRSCRVSLQKVLSGNEEMLAAFLKGVTRFKRVAKGGR